MTRVMEKVVAQLVREMHDDEAATQDYLLERGAWAPVDLEVVAPAHAVLPPQDSTPPTRDN